MNIEERCSFLEERIRRLNEIGIALSTEKDTNKLFELILEEAKNITNADGRTLYMMDDKGNLKFEIMRNDSMNTVMGGTSGVDIPYPPVPKYFGDGEPNLNNVCAYAAITGETINIEDAYEEKGYDFSGAKAYDKNSGYRSKSFLTMPLKNHENEIIGVMQLINAKDKNTGEVIPFTPEVQEQVESIASQGAVSLTNKRLVEGLKILFEAFIKLIATAIDKKSEYTGGHCNRVPVITMMLAEAVEKADYGKYKDFSMTEDERYELYIAGWLHDCGKVATPPHVVDKGTKLETITDRIDTVKTRFEVLRRDAEIDYLKKKMKLNGSSNGSLKKFEKEYNDKLEQLTDDETFIEKCNVGGEFMQQELQDRVVNISKYDYVDHGEKKSFLSENEIRNLNIAKGTLLPEEREIINDHIVITIDMLNELPYPKHLRKVPEFAGGHHEKLDGTGYPKGLIDADMSVQAKMMAIADIFEALTAADRPYKDGKKLSMAMRIMGFMKNDYHIDKDLFEIFVKEGVYKTYAKDYLNKSQIDEVDKKTLLS